jgi:hypothetical protein
MPDNLPAAPLRPAPPSVVFELRERHVMLAAQAAGAFGVETREIVQNITRNPELFPEHYAFQMTEAERDDLRSREVIPRPGRGGSRALPWVVTQKGAIRLATLMKSPKAIEAADLFIDVFSEVLTQLYAGRTRIGVSDPSRLTPSPDDLKQATRLRGRIYAAMEDLLDTVIDTRNKTTVRDELGDVASGTLGHVREWLKTRKLGNEQTEAQTVLILEQVRDMAERRQSEMADARLTREGKALENLQRKIAIVKDLIGMLDRVEPNAVVSLLGGFAPGPSK